jgi:hypothetical protein
LCTAASRSTEPGVDKPVLTETRRAYTDNQQGTAMITFYRWCVFLAVVLAAAALGQAYFACEDSCRKTLDQSVKECMVGADFSSPAYDVCISNAFSVYRGCLRECVQDDYFERRKDSP